MIILRKSKWQFNTSAGGGIGFDALNAEAGMFALDQPKGQSHKFAYSAFGMGLSRSLSSLLRLPRFALPKVLVKKGELSGSGSTSDFTSQGWLYLTNSYQGHDLTNPRTLEGGTVYLEGAAGYLFGGTGSLMLLGINREFMLLGIMKPDIISMAVRSAPAALIMGGVNEGLQDTAGVAVMLGQVKYSGAYSEDPN